MKCFCWKKMCEKSSARLNVAYSCAVPLVIWQNGTRLNVSSGEQICLMHSWSTTGGKSLPSVIKTNTVLINKLWQIHMEYIDLEHTIDSSINKKTTKKNKTKQKTTDDSIWCSSPAPSSFFQLGLLFSSSDTPNCYSHLFYFVSFCTWNKLPHSVRHSSASSTFRYLLKSHLFKQ